MSHSINAHHIRSQLVRIRGVNSGTLASRPASFPITTVDYNDVPPRASFSGGVRDGLNADEGGRGRPGRTVYLSNIPVGATIAQVLNLVNFGPLETVQAHPSTSAFKRLPSASPSAFPAWYPPASPWRPSQKNAAPAASSSPSQETTNLWNDAPPNAYDAHNPPPPPPVLPSLFLTFLDLPTALAFVASASSPAGKLYLQGRELRTNWANGTPRITSKWVQRGIAEAHASRTVHLHHLPPALSASASALRGALDERRFGYIEYAQVVVDGRGARMGLVSFLSIADAIKAVTTIQNLPAWAGVRADYGRDRCCPFVREAPVAGTGSSHPVAAVDSPHMDPTSAQFGPQAIAGSRTSDDVPRAGANRSVYLYDIPASASVEDLCDVVRGGMLQTVSLHNIHGRRTGLVTFIRPLAALAFYERSISHGLTLRDHPLQITWVRNSVPLSPRLAAAVSSGASRSIRIEKEPNLKFDYFTEQALRADFGAFGDLERVEVLKDKQCAVVHFTNIWNAIKAIKEIKTRPEYALLNITYGEDRCAGPLPLLSAPLPGSAA
ncbi:hypothetical protein C8F04DRAFT_328413 [Mycena alexandri]|uniref:RRM domain-containing protein n=1 Tax=Mycena alexandri TaxID=1745969 RepID=A0AAD6S4G3_9AGAR|nr:hypothetical protein C8F04DRAFT_328413 [Mycena alexandri]